MKVLRTKEDVLSLKYDEQCLVYSSISRSFRIHTLVQLSTTLMKLKGLQSGHGIYAHSKEQLFIFLDGMFSLQLYKG